MGNTTTTIKNIAGAVTNGITEEIDDKLPEGDKYFGFINVHS